MHRTVQIPEHIGAIIVHLLHCLLMPRQCTSFTSRHKQSRHFLVLDMIHTRTNGAKIPTCDIEMRAHGRESLQRQRIVDFCSAMITRATQWVFNKGVRVRMADNSVCGTVTSHRDPFYLDSLTLVAVQISANISWKICRVWASRGEIFCVRWYGQHRRRETKICSIRK